MRGTARLATYIGRILMAIGFVLIILAWDKASRLDFIQGQFPFLMSASIPGLALIIVGAGLEYVQALRTFTARRAKQMAELNVAVVRLVGFVRDNGGLPRASSGEDLTLPIPVGVGTGGSSQPGAVAASSVAGTQGGAPTTALGSDLVVAGRSSFHQADCHLVAGRDDMKTITRLEAEAGSLSACRVCKP